MAINSQSFSLREKHWVRHLCTPAAEYAALKQKIADVPAEPANCRALLISCRMISTSASGLHGFIKFTPNGLHCRGVDLVGGYDVSQGTGLELTRNVTEAVLVCWPEARSFCAHPSYVDIFEMK